MRSVLVLAVSALLVAAAEPARSGAVTTCDLQSDCLQVIGATEAHAEIHPDLGWLQAGCSDDGTQRKVCLSWSKSETCSQDSSISHACATTYDPRESIKVDTFLETQYICQIIDNPGSIEVDVCENEPVFCTDGSGCTALQPSGCTELCHECNHIHEFNTGYSGTPESGCDGLTGAELAKCNCLSTCVEHAYFGVKDGKATSGEAEPEQAFDINIGSQTLIDGVWNGVWNTSETTCEFIPEADCVVDDASICYTCDIGGNPQVPTVSYGTFSSEQTCGVKKNGSFPASIFADNPATGHFTVDLDEATTTTCIAYQWNPPSDKRRSLAVGPPSADTGPAPGDEATLIVAGFVDNTLDTTLHGFGCGNSQEEGAALPGWGSVETPPPPSRRLRRGLRTQPRRRLFEHGTATEDLCDGTGSSPGERLWTIPTAPCVKTEKPDPCEGRFCDCDLGDLEFKACINALEDDGCLEIEECCGVLRAYGEGVGGVACAERQAGYDLPYAGCGADGQPPCVGLVGS